MKRVLTVVILLALTLQACSSRKTIGNVNYDTYGLINEKDKHNPNIEYEVVWGNVFWSIVFSETIIIPIYFIGFDLFEPVGPVPPIIGEHVNQ